MRRFLIWSGLSALIGLILAIGGVWAYNHFYVRFQPVALDRNQAEIQSLLDSASWVSQGGGSQPVYVVGYRDSDPTLTYMQQEAPKLHAGGADVRVVLFARPDVDGEVRSTPSERAAIAELWLSRDWSLYQRWIATPTNQWTADGLAPADGNLARTAVIKGSHEFANQLSDLLKQAGVRTNWPLVIWRDRQGFLKACACSDPRSWAYIRDDIGAPEALGGMGSAETGLDGNTGGNPFENPAQGVAPVAGEVPLAYPDLPSVPPVQALGQGQGRTPGQTAGQPPSGVSPPATAGGPARPAPSRRLERQPPRTTPGSAPRPTSRPAPPKAVQDEDTRFY